MVNYLTNIPDKSTKQTLCVMLVGLKEKPKTWKDMENCDFYIINGQHNVEANKFIVVEKNGIVEDIRFLEGVNLFHHSEHNVYNMWLIEGSRPLDGRTRIYDNSTKNTPPPLSRNAEFLVTPQSINAAANNTCCSQSYVQHYPRAKITVLRSHMYNKTTVQFRNHIKLDIHRQFHRDATGRDVVTLEGIDICPFAWMKIMGVSLSTFYHIAKFAAVGHAVQNPVNTGLCKLSHTVVATAMLGAILDRHADHMPHKTRVLPSGEKVVAKVLPSNFKWKDQIPLVE